VPRKIRQLAKDLRDAGFELLPGAAKDSHRKFVHAMYPGTVTLSGKDNDDAKHYQEKQVRRAIEEVQQ
jgi:predicted RNA binding protein YcfA (HicA-like mRNA interferase family)